MKLEIKVLNAMRLTKLLIAAQFPSEKHAEKNQCTKICRYTK